MLETLLTIDGNILLWIQDNLRNPVLTSFLKVITSLGNAGWIWILITAGLLIFKKTRPVGIMSAMALVGSLLVNNLILKNLVARVRPYEVVDGLTLLIEKQKDWSFPSGHSASSFAAAGVLFLNLPKRYGISVLVLAALIAFSRLYVGVHYPSDVLFGVVDGLVLSFMAKWMYTKYGKYFSN